MTSGKPSVGAKTGPAIRVKIDSGAPTDGKSAIRVKNASGPKPRSHANTASSAGRSWKPSVCSAQTTNPHATTPLTAKPVSSSQRGAERSRFM